MSATDERLAIWRYATPAERQRVIDGAWQHFKSMPLQRQYIAVGAYRSCPLGAAFLIKRGRALRVMPLAFEVGGHLADRGDPTEVEARAAAFMAAWDTGQITADDLTAYLRRLNAQEATR